MRLGVLGPLTVSGADGAPLHVGGVKRRALLATLALSPNQTVPVDRLTAVLWGDEPPQSYVSNLQTYVSAVRRVLAGADAEGDGRIAHDTTGYRLTVSNGELDLLLFRRRLRDGRAALAEGDAGTVATALGEALALWRGEPLAGLDLAGLTAEIDVLTDELAGAAEDWAMAGLELGDGASLAPRLRGLVAAHPLRERLRALLIRALAAAGRQAEALEIYREGYAILADELGIEPGTELRAAHAEVLRGTTADPAPAAAAPPAAPPAFARGPFPLVQLPYDIPDFTGRERHVRQACHALTPDGTTGLPLVTVSGSPGVGKTALAVHVAHRLRAEFPDGQLFTHLGGAHRPREPAQILGEWLRALGMAGAQIPDDTAERAAAFRSRLADRRVLVVLDDAADEAQVRPLLPGTSGSAVLVTARNRLAGLAGGRIVALEPLSQIESRELLRHVVGTERVGGERAADEIATACARLPLALRIAGARLAAKDGWALDDLADRLRDERRRLDELSVGDLEVRAGLGLSYDGLDEPARAALRRTGMLGMSQIAPWMARVLAGGDAPLTALTHANLLDTVAGPGGTEYHVHDLLRVYAREVAELAADPADVAAFDALTGVTVALADAVSRHEPKSYGAPPEPVAELAAPPADELARLEADPSGWISRHRRHLTTYVLTCCEMGRHREAMAIARRIEPPLCRDSRFDEVGRMFATIAATADAAGDPAPAARARLAHASFVLMRGRLAEAGGEIDLCIAELEQIGDRRSLPYALRLRGFVYAQRGEHEPALVMQRRAIDLAREAGEREAEAMALRDTGSALRAAGRLRRSLVALDEALLAARSLGDPVFEAHALDSLVLTQMELGDHEAAGKSCDRAIELIRPNQDPYGIAYLSLHRIRISQALGAHREALDTGAWVLGTFEDLGDRRGEALALRHMATSDLALGDTTRGRTRLRDALALAGELGLTRVERACRDLLASLDQAPTP